MDILRQCRKKTFLSPLTSLPRRKAPQLLPPRNCLSPLTSLKPAPKIFKETCEIDWTKTAKQVYDFVRGLSPVPGAWTTLVAPDGKETVLKVYKTRKTGKQGQGSGIITTDGKALYISAGDALLEIVELQLAGKKRMQARDFLNGMKGIEQYRVKKKCDSI